MSYAFGFTVRFSQHWPHSRHFVCPVHPVLLIPSHLALSTLNTHSGWWMMFTVMVEDKSVGAEPPESEAGLVSLMVCRQWNPLSLSLYQRLWTCSLCFLAYLQPICYIASSLPSRRDVTVCQFHSRTMSSTLRAIKQFLLCDKISIKSFSKGRR